MGTKSAQSFESIRASCLASKKLFEDPNFPAVATSIYYSKPVSPHISWKRPKEICTNPQFIVDGCTRFDLDQGNLGNCWFVAAAATLTTNATLLKNVIPMDQSFSEGWYAGVFRFRFWRFGEVQEVVVDDRLPVKYGKLEFCKNREQPNEFWSALLEKAYAKLNGSYEALLFGKIQDALVDFTGGVGEMIELPDRTRTPDQLFMFMTSLLTMNTLMGCSLSLLGMTNPSESENGLIYGHAYSITDIKVITYNNNPLRLIRVMNPWGKSEWKGAWFDGYSEWSKVSKTTINQLEFKAVEDGEFWMTFDDWLANFNELQLCHLTSTSLSRRSWYMGVAHGAWIKGVSAGGSGNSQVDEGDYWNNPQYYVTLSPPDEGESIGSTCTIVVSLMQKYRREIQQQGGVTSTNKTIGFRILQLKKNQIQAVKTAYPNEATVLYQDYCPYREVAHEYELPPGVYCIIPTTFEVGDEAEFMLRMLTQQITEIKQLDEKNQFPLSLAVPVGPAPSYTQAFYEKAECPSDDVDGGVEGLVEVEEPLVVQHVATMQATPLPTGASAYNSSDTVDMTNKVASFLSSAFNLQLSVADLEVQEVYDAHVSDGDVIYAADLQLMLTSLSEMGQLGGYTNLQLSIADARLLLNFIHSAPGRHVPFEEFLDFIKEIKKWIYVFSTFDEETTSFLHFNLVWLALSEIGLPSTTEMKQIIGLSYGGRQNGLFLEDFINCVAKLMTVKEICSNDDVSITFEEMSRYVLKT